MIMKCPLGIYFRANYVLRCFTVLLRYTESYSVQRTLFPCKQAHTSYKHMGLYPGIGPVGL